jgi:hypothetical protein
MQIGIAGIQKLHVVVRLDCITTSRSNTWQNLQNPLRLSLI